MSKKVTINDVAREANTSIGTVYRAVYNYGRVSEKTRKHVMETVERLGYRANSVARGLALRSKFTILVIMLQSPENFWDDVRKGTMRAASKLSEFGVRIIEFYHTGGVAAGKTIMDVIAEQKVDAIAMSIVMLDDCGKVLTFASDNNIPVAIFNEETVSRDRLFYYGPDNCRAGSIAAELINKFSGKPGGACCTIQRTDYTSSNAAILLRDQGFQEYLAKHCPDIRFAGTYRCVLGETPLVIRQILNDHPDITGIYFTEYEQLSINYKMFDNKQRKIAVIGHEYRDEYREALRRNTITALLVQERGCQGYYPLMMLYDYLVSGVKPSQDSYYSNINVIIDSNADCLLNSSNGCGYE